MPPIDPGWEELTWNWANKTGHPASQRQVLAAAEAAWSYSRLCAWTYLHDRESALDLMEHAHQNATEYVARHPGVTVEKLTARIRSVIRRRAKQLLAKRMREVPVGSMAEMERLATGQMAVEERVYANELLSRFSPFAQRIVIWRWHGYTWREIGRELGMDHTAVRRAYLRELESLLQSLSSPGASGK